jgi:hypothetical protein
MSLEEFLFEVGRLEFYFLGPAIVRPWLEFDENFAGIKYDLFALGLNVWLRSLG